MFSFFFLVLFEHQTSAQLYVVDAYYFSNKYYNPNVLFNISFVFSIIVFLSLGITNLFERCEGPIGGAEVLAYSGKPYHSEWTPFVKFE